jgi:hypothetical protein
MDTRQCIKCNNVKQLIDFCSNYDNRKNLRFYHKTCKECYNTHRRNTIKAAKERYKDGLYVCQKCSNIKPAETFFQNGIRSKFCGDCNSISLVEHLTEKQCSKCKFIKPIERFTINRARKSGYEACCRVCTNASQRSQISRKVEPPLFKPCSTCKENKSISLFHKNSHNKDGHEYSCIDCRKIFAKKSKERNPDKVNENRKYVSIFRTDYSFQLPKSTPSEVIEIRAFLVYIKRKIKEMS